MKFKTSKNLFVSGFIKFVTGSSNSVESAINFLYGQCPKIDKDNVADILEVAEFLMIDELKALCIHWLRSMNVNIDNCLQVMIIASRYDFHIERAAEFIIVNLSELLLNDQMMFIDKQSVRFILTDPQLTYVSREECLKFLLKWISHCPSRQTEFADLVSCLDLDDIDLEVLGTVNLELINENDRLLLNKIASNTRRSYDVLIVSPPKHTAASEIYLAYNLERKSWNQITATANLRSYDVSTIKDETTLISLNLSKDKIRYLNLVTKDDTGKAILTQLINGEDEPIFHQLAVSDNKIYGVTNETIYVNKKSNLLANLSSVEMLLLGLGIHEISSLYVSGNEEDTAISMIPLISVRGSVQSLCVTGDMACLLIPKHKQIIVHSLTEHRVKIIDISAYELDHKSYVYPSRNRGFYTITRSHILEVNLGIEGSNITTGVAEFCYKHQTKDDSNSIHAFQECGTRYEITTDTIVSIRRNPENYETQICYQRKPEQISNLHKEETVIIEVPEELKHSNDFHFLQVKLPKQVLRCPVNCPHCKHNATREEIMT